MPLKGKGWKEEKNKGEMKGRKGKKRGRAGAREGERKRVGRKEGRKMGRREEKEGGVDTKLFCYLKFSFHTYWKCSSNPSRCRLFFIIC